MEYDKNVCPVVDVDGVIASGKQFDLDIRIPEDNRNVIYGVIKDCYGDPVKDAVVKLIEIVCECGKEERRPVSHTFTNKDGDFVFGPLCTNKYYAIEIWVDHVKHCKICVEGKHEGKCLKGVKMDCNHEFKCYKPFDKKCEEKHDDKCDEKNEDKYDDKFEKTCHTPCNKPCFRPCDK